MKCLKYRKNTQNTKKSKKKKSLVNEGIFYILVPYPLCVLTNTFSSHFDQLSFSLCLNLNYQSKVMSV